MGSGSQKYSRRQQPHRAVSLEDDPRCYGERRRPNILSTVQPEEPVLIQLNLDTGGGAEKMTGRGYPFADAPLATVTSDINGLDLEKVAPLLKSGRIRKLPNKADPVAIVPSQVGGYQ